MKIEQHCEYRRNYLNFQNQVIEEFICNEPALDSGLCKFHDECYFLDHKSELNDLLNQKIEQSIEYNIPLKCVGYIFSSINISKKKICMPISFVAAKFLGDAIFDNCEFSYVDFSHAEFNSDVSFINAVFNEEADFSNTKINNKALFQKSNFIKNSDFSNCSVLEATFFLTTFHETDFSNSIFAKSISFISSKFIDKATFSRVIFQDIVNFSFSKFYDEIYFIDTIFKDYAYFRSVQFTQQENCTFDCDLSWVSFAYTDITRIHFRNRTKWSHRNITSKTDKIRTKLKSRNSNFKIFDEWLIENGKDPKLELETVKDIYRNLRENYDLYLRYEISGEFFVREMDLKRKYRDNPKLIGNRTIKKHPVKQILSLLGIYNIISLYGHSIYRPIFASIPIMIIASFAFLTDNFTNFKINYDIGWDAPIVNAILRSLSGFIPIYSMTNDPKFFDVVLKLILLPMSGTFFIALRRRLERQFRH